MVFSIHFPSAKNFSCVHIFNPYNHRMKWDGAVREQRTTGSAYMLPKGLQWRSWDLNTGRLALDLLSITSNIMFSGHHRRSCAQLAAPSFLNHSSLTVELLLRQDLESGCPSACTHWMLNYRAFDSHFLGWENNAKKHMQMLPPWLCGFMILVEAN